MQPWPRLRQNSGMERADRTFFAWNAAVSTMTTAFIAYILRRDAGPTGKRLRVSAASQVIHPQEVANERR